MYSKPDPTQTMHYPNLAKVNKSDRIQCHTSALQAAKG